MEVRIKGLRLENYKCFNVSNVDFGKETVISGRNRSGKTTMMDAYFDIFTGKLADGTSPDKVRPHDQNGLDIPKIDVIRELVLTIDGEEHYIKKITSQKWRKPRGQTEEVLDGNETTYEVDGFQMKSKEFNEFMAKIAPSDTLLMCSNAQPFFSLIRKSTSEARKLLEKLSGFDVDTFISENPQYQSVSEITKGHNIEDVMKKLRKQQSDQKKKLDAKNTEVKYESNLSPVKIEVSDLELQKGIYKEEISKLDADDISMEDAADKYEKKHMDKMKIQSKMEEIAHRESVDINTKRDVHISEMNILKKKYQECKNSVAYYQDLASRAKRECERIKETISDIEIKLRNKEQVVFDEKEKFCSYCGQELPAEKQEEALKEFNRGQKSVLTRFNAQLKEAKNDLALEEKRISDNNTKISELNIEMEAIKNEFHKIQAKVNNLPEKPDLSNNEEYLELAAQYEKITEELSHEVDYTAKKRENRRKRSELLKNISDIDAKINNANEEQERHEARLDALKKEQRSMGQALADIEKQIDMVQEFSLEKNKALADAINSHFKHFQFKLLDYTLEGTPIETCRMMVDGTDYNNGLNGGDKRLTEIDLCRGLQEMNGLVLPIWCDEAGTVDDWRIPKDMKQQLILIEYKNDEFSVAER